MILSVRHIDVAQYINSDTRWEIELSSRRIEPITAVALVKAYPSDCRDLASSRRYLPYTMIRSVRHVDVARCINSDTICEIELSSRRIEPISAVAPVKAYPSDCCDVILDTSCKSPTRLNDGNLPGIMQCCSFPIVDSSTCSPYVDNLITNMIICCWFC